MSRGGAGNVYLSRRQPEMVSDPACSGTIECALAGMADHLLLLGWFVLLIVVAVGSLMFLPRARELCDVERRRTRAEYEAFDRFIGRARQIIPSANAPNISTGGPTPLLQQQANSSSGQLNALRQAYEDTVMSVPHFEEEYGETVAEHMREELSDEIAEAVISESNLTAPLHQSVVDAAYAARERRAHFLEMLEEEADSLANHEKTLQQIERGVSIATEPLCADQSFGGLQEQHAELKQYESQIEHIVNERQADRTDGKSGAMRSGQSVDLQSYLYFPMEARYPVVAEAAALLTRVTVTLRRVEDELIYRG